MFEGRISLKNLTIALIGVLLYEILIKLTYPLIPSALEATILYGVIMAFSDKYYLLMHLLFFITHAVIIYFLYQYYHNKTGIESL